MNWLEIHFRNYVLIGGPQWYKVTIHKVNVRFLHPLIKIVRIGTWEP